MLVTPVLFLLWQVKVPAVKSVYTNAKMCIMKSSYQWEFLFWVFFPFSIIDVNLILCVCSAKMNVCKIKKLFQIQEWISTKQLLEIETDL